MLRFLPPSPTARPRRRLAPALGALAILIGSVARAYAEDAPLSVQRLQRELERVENAAQLDPTVRTQARERYESALGHLNRAQEFAARAGDFERQAAEAPALLARIREELAQPPVKPQLSISADTPLVQIEQQLAEAEAELAAARKQAEELAAEPKRRTERRAALSTELTRVKSQLAEVAEALQAPAPSGEPAALTAARRSALQAKQYALQQELQAYQAEGASYDARSELLPAREDRARRRVAHAEARAAALQEIALERRRLAAEKSARDAERAIREASLKAPQLKELAEETQRLAAMRSGPDGVTAALEATTQQLNETRERLENLRESYLRIQRKMDAAGLTNAMGLVLRKQYEELPNTTALERKIRAREDRISDAQYQLIVLEEERQAMGDVEREVQRILAAARQRGPEDGLAELESTARKLLTDRRELLESLIDDYTVYFDRLVDLDSAQRALLEIATAYRGYIEERILWVPSVGGYGLLSPSAALSALWWLVRPDAWLLGLRAALVQSVADWTATVTTLLVLGLLFGLRAWDRRILARTAGGVGHPTRDRFAYTLQALLATALLSLPFPALVWFVGWRLGAPPDQAPVALAASAGLRVAAAFFATLEFIRHLLRPSGLGSAHFQWSERGSAFLRRQIRWLGVLVLPLTALVFAFDHHGNEAWNHSLGRVLFSAALITLAVFNHRVFHPTSAYMAEVRRRNPGGWCDRFAIPLYRAAVAVPLVFVAFAFFGYYYTARHLVRRLNASIGLGILLLLADALAYRWLFITRERVAIERARKRREALKAERDRETAGTPAPVAADAPSTAASEEADLDIPAVSEQTRHLFRNLSLLAFVLGLYVIWASVLPALSMLDRVQIFPDVRILEEVSDDADIILGTPAAHADRAAPAPGAAGGAEATALAPQGPLEALQAAAKDAGGADVLPGSITLADVGLALVLALLTLVATRNLPGLVEMALLSRLPMDAGARYAIKTVLQYAISIVGLTAAFGAIGVGWAKVQWLAAALTFGLAFGLQEIFANFVSGLIILAERPIRVGDTVTINDVVGTVSRIRMRATTITDWDRKELIVPNKSFITGQLINWTLSDPILRIIVPVGVAYGSDVQKTEETLLRVARECPFVLREPEPRALFLGFGDSSLTFELRVFIPSIDHFLTSKHELHKAIDAAFRAEHIEIAFPQRDLHIRTAEALQPYFREQPPAKGQ